MLKRCSPRSSTSAVSGNGSASAAAAPFFPVKNTASSCSVPRATVPSTSGRALDAFLKNTLARSGIAFGELCMSCRHAAADRRQKAKGSRQKTRRAPRLALRASHLASGLNFIDLARVESLQELQRPLAIELRIVRLDQQEELVAAGVLEAGHVERRVVGRGQPVQEDHPEHGRERREEN